MVRFKFIEQFTSRVLVVSLFMLFLNSYEFSSKADTINISPSGKDSSGCGNASNPCQSLDFVFSTVHDFNGTVLQLRGNLSLNESHRLQNVHDFGIVGKRLSTEHAEKIEILCRGNASLAFENSDRINLESFTLRGCGGVWYDSWSERNKTGVPVALFFNFCSNIKLLSIDVLESHGRAVIMLDIAGKVTFKHCVFADNTPGDNVDEHPGNVSCLPVGGGVLLKLTTKGDVHQNISSQHQVLHNDNNHYIFVNCIFQNNRVKSFSLKNANNCSIPKSLDRGGGLGISFEGNASHNIIEIFLSKFTGNEAEHGGGLYVQFSSFSQHNTLEIGRCTFEQNFAGMEGGGACLGTHNPKLTEALIPHSFNVYDCSFENNTSVWGGGLSIFGETGRTGTGLPNAKFNYALIKNCQWFRNEGTVGSAIAAFLTNLNEDEIGPSVPYHLKLENCTIGYNKVTVRPGSRLIIGQGAVFSVMVPIILRYLSKLSQMFVQHFKLLPRLTEILKS